MLGRWPDWVPVLVLASGLALVGSSRAQTPLPLRLPLDEAIPGQIGGFVAHDVAIADAEIAALGTTAQVLRTYRRADGTTPFFTVYVGYYASQTHGRTIHSPRNCLPGGGWEVLQFRREPVQTPAGPLVVARYLIQRGDQQALVFYWYQGRGRVEADEYIVKYQLLRDAALKGRSEEALVRIMIPIGKDIEPSLAVAHEVTGLLVPSVFQALPEA